MIPLPLRGFFHNKPPFCSETTPTLGHHTFGEKKETQNMAVGPKCNCHYIDDRAIVAKERKAENKNFLKHIYYCCSPFTLTLEGILSTNCNELIKKVELLFGKNAHVIRENVHNYSK